RRPRAEVLLHELAWEAVDAGWHRRVGGEDAARTHPLDGLLERHAIVGNSAADALEGEEPGVALVAVEHVSLDAPLREQTHATDAQHDLLAQPVLDVAAVEAVGDPVDVKQIEADGPKVIAPHLGLDRLARKLQAHPRID